MTGLRAVGRKLLCAAAARRISTAAAISFTVPLPNVMLASEKDSVAAAPGRILQLTSTGEVTNVNFDQVVESYADLKEARMDLFRRVKEILDRLNVPYWLDCGSLIGAYRQGGMLPYDYDFDFSVYGRAEHDKVRVELRKLPAQFAFKDGTSWSHKYEIYNKDVGLLKSVGDVLHPEHFAPEKQWYAVAGDVYLYEDSPVDKDLIVLNYVGSGNEDRRYRRDWVFPLSTIEFEGMTVPCPRDVRSHLEEMYGYIGADYRFEPSTNRYVKRESEDV